MQIGRTPLGSLGANCYQVLNEETKQLVLIDPGDCPDAFLNQLKAGGYQVEAILLTHGHFDHMLGAKRLSEEFQCPIYAHEDEKELLLDPQKNLSVMHQSAHSIEDIVTVKDGEILTIANFPFKVIHTPGHTGGGCCYYMEEYHVVFSGDTLFKQSVGRSDFPTGDFFTLLRSVKEKLFVLPDETVVLPGHMDETEIGFEKKNNPYVHL